jgi:hypothetical protein
LTGKFDLTGNSSQPNSRQWESTVYATIGSKQTNLKLVTLVKWLSKSVLHFHPVESNSDESKFRLSQIKVLVLRCRKPYYLHSLSQIYLSKHVYYLRIKIGSHGPNKVLLVLDQRTSAHLEDCVCIILSNLWSIYYMCVILWNINISEIIF